VTTFFYAWDHLGTIRLVSNPDRTMLDRHDYEPFGVELRPILNQTSNTHQFTGHERDQASEYDYMHFRFYGSTMGRFMKPDAIPGKPRDPQSLNLYTYVQNNPINRVDPLGLNWFLIEGKWQWHKGDRYTVGSGDTAKTYTSNYTHLMVVKLDYVKDGVSHYKVALYNQNNKTPVATGTAFSGGAMRSDGTMAPAVPDGNYFIRGDWHHSAPDRINPRSPDNNPPQDYGMQPIGKNSLTNYDTGVSGYQVWPAYGPMRAYLNPLGDPEGRTGDYYHGQQAGATQPGRTHSCLSYGTDDTIIRAIWDAYAPTGVSIDTPVEPPQ
jgi:RHS repeat-associated protein